MNENDARGSPMPWLAEARAYIREKLYEYPPNTWIKAELSIEAWCLSKNIAYLELEPLVVALEEIVLQERKDAGEFPQAYEPDENDDGGKKIPREWSEVAKIKFPENQWRISQIIPLSGFTFIAATSGGKKTWVAADMVEAITKPRLFLHNEFFQTQGCNVLYIDGEMALSEFQRRGRQLGFDDERKYKIYLLNVDNLNLYSEESKDLERVIEFVKSHEVAVVILDTFRAVAGGLKEEKAEEIRMFFNRLKALKDMGVSVILLDHLRKKLPGEGKTPNKEQLFSSMDKAANSDVIEMLKPDDASDNLIMYQVKNRLGKDLRPFRIKMTDSSFPDDPNNRTKLEFDDWLEEDETLIAQAKVVIVEALADGPKKRKELLTIAKKAKITGERTVRRAYKELEEAGIITSKKIGRELTFTLADPSKQEVADENADNDDF